MGDRKYESICRQNCQYFKLPTDSLVHLLSNSEEMNIMFSIPILYIPFLLCLLVLFATAQDPVSRLHFPMGIIQEVPPAVCYHDQHLFSSMSEMCLKYDAILLSTIIWAQLHSTSMVFTIVALFKQFIHFWVCLPHRPTQEYATYSNLPTLVMLVVAS